MNFADVERDYIRQYFVPSFEWVVSPAPSPVNPLPKPIAQSRVALVGTAGVHLDADHPFDARNPLGDPSFRVIPGDAPFDTLRLSHPGYNTRKITQDINCVFPLERLRELAQEGVVGSVSPRHFSFMGYIPIPNLLIEKIAPAVAHLLKADQVDLALLVPAWPVCQQSVGLIQRAVDEAGIPTISLTLVREITEQVKPSRALYIEHPFGHTLGDVGDKTLQRRILLTCLEAAVRLTEPGTIRALPYRWTKDDLRERQLQKKAH